MHRFLQFIFSINFIYLIIIAVQVAAIIFLSVFLPSVLPFVTLYMAGFALNLVAGFMLLSRHGENEIKLAWLLFILSVPFLGSACYFLFSHRKKREYSFQLSLKGGTPISRAANSLCGSAEVGFEKAEYYSSGREFFDNLFAEIDRAERYIYAEFYIIDRGEIYSKFVEALKNAKARGVKIKILADGLGTLFKLRRAKRRLQGIAELKFYAKFSPFPKRLNVRTHRKIVVIDGTVAFTGGVNLADEYANLISPYGHWKDIGIKVTGSAAKVFEGLFLALWDRHFAEDAPKTSTQNCLVYADSPDRHFLKSAYLAEIYSAKKRVHIMTPYLSLPSDLISALSFAAAKGVDVKIIIPAIPDKPYAYEITKAYACKLTERGVKVFCYDLGFVHAKSFIADSRCFIGSSNLDFRSLCYNYECGISFEGEMMENAERDFVNTLNNCSEFSDCSTKFKSIKRAITRLFAPLI